MEGRDSEFGMDMYTLLYFKWMTNKDLLYSTGNSAQCYIAAWMGGEFGGEWIHVYVWLSPFTIYLKLSQHFFFLFYLWWISSYIEMKQPWVYMDHNIVNRLYSSTR